MRTELSRSGQDGAGSLKLLSRSAKHGTLALFPIRCNARPIGLYGITDYSLVLLHLLWIALDCRNRYGRLRLSRRHGSRKLTLRLNTPSPSYEDGLFNSHPVSRV